MKVLFWKGFILKKIYIYIYISKTRRERYVFFPFGVSRLKDQNMAIK